MRKSCKRILALLLALTMVVSMSITTSFAADPVVTVSTEMETVTTREDDATIYRLVFDVFSPNGVSAMSLMMSYDNTVIVPVASSSAGYIDLPELNNEYISYAMETLLLTKPLLGSGVPYSTAGIRYLESSETNRSAVFKDIYANENPIKEMTEKQHTLAFYFRIADGKSVDDLAKGTFRVETDKSEGSFLAMYYTSEEALKGAAGLEIADKAEP